MGKSDLKVLLKELDAQGFTARRTKKGHYLVRDAQGQVVTTMSGTPSDRRAWNNGIAALRRAGFEWPPKR